MAFLGDLPSSNGVLNTFNKRKMKRPFKSYVSTAAPTVPQVQITSFNCPMHLLVRTLQLKKATEGERKAAQVQMKKQIEKQMAALQNNLVVQQGQVRRQGITVSVQPAAHIPTEVHSQQLLSQETAAAAASAHVPINSRPTPIAESVPSTPVLIPSSSSNPNVRIGSNRNPSPTSMTLNLLRKRRPLLRPLAVPATPNDSSAATSAATAAAVVAVVAASAAASTHSMAPRAGIHSRSHPIVTYHVSGNSNSQRAKRNRERGASDEAEQGAPAATGLDAIEEDETIESPRAVKRPKLSSPTQLHASVSADRVRSPPAPNRVPVYHVRSAPGPAAAAASSSSYQLPPRAPSPAHSIGSQSQSSQPSRAPSTSSAYRSLAASLSQTAAKSSNPAAAGSASHSASRANFALAMPSVPMTPMIPLTPSMHNSAALPRLAYQTPGSILAANLAASAREQFQLMHPNLALRAQQQQATYALSHHAPHVSIEDSQPTSVAAGGGGSRYSRGLLRMQEARKEEQRRRDAAAAVAIQEAQKEIRRQEERKQERGGVSSAEEEEEPEIQRARSSKPAECSTATGIDDQQATNSMFTPPRLLMDPPTPREPISLPSKRKTRQAVIESAAAAAAAAISEADGDPADTDEHATAEVANDTSPRSNKRTKRTR